MQVLSQCEKKAVGAGVSPFLGGLLHISINFIKKLIPGQKKSPHIVSDDAELGRGIT